MQLNNERRPHQKKRIRRPKPNWKLPSPMAILPEITSKDAGRAALKYDAAIKHAMKVGEAFKGNELHARCQAMQARLLVQDWNHDPVEARKAIDEHRAFFKVIQAQLLAYKRAEAAIYIAWAEYERASRLSVLEVPRKPSILRPIVQAATPGGPPPAMPAVAPPEPFVKPKRGLSPREMGLQRRAEILYPSMRNRRRGDR